MLYGHSSTGLIRESALNDEFAPDLVQEMVNLIAYDDITHTSSEQIQEFCNSPIADVLLEKKVFDAKVIRKSLSKESDMARRTKIAAYKLAENDNDAAFKKMCMYRAKMKEERAKVLKKYGARAKKLAYKGQVEYVKTARKGGAKGPDPAKASGVANLKSSIENE